MSQGWYAYDLDGTLAEYNGWVGIDHIGKPVQKLINEVKKLLKQGKDVRIFTARVYPLGVERGFTDLGPDEYLARMMQARLAKEVIEKFCQEQFGKVLPVTCVKDFGMITLTDDRLKQVIPNTGEYVEDLMNHYRRLYLRSKILKVYYAHCLALYGTKQEERDIATLKKLGFNVENPNTPKHDIGFKAQGISYVMDVVKRCDALAFRALPDGRIPGGVAYEIEVFRHEGLPIIELPSQIRGRVIDKEQTREYLYEVGYR